MREKIDPTFRPNEPLDSEQPDASVAAVEKKTSLTRIFTKAVRVYLLPHPLRYKEVIAAIAAQTAIFWTMGVALYPSVGDYLVRNGMPETDVKTLNLPLLSIVKPTPRFSKPVDKIHKAFSSMSALGMGVTVFQENEPALADSRSFYLGCEIRLMPPNSFTAKDILYGISDIPKDKIGNLPISNRTILNYVVLHEVGHCKRQEDYTWTSRAIAIFPEKYFSKEQLDADYIRQNKDELRADVAAIEENKKAFNDKGISDLVLHFRAVNLGFVVLDKDHPHDLALSLDAIKRKINLPTLDEMRNSRRELVNAYKIYQKSGYGVPGRDASTIAADFGYAMKDILKDKNNGLSPWAKRRAELYIEAVNYFAPELLREPVRSKKSKWPDYKVPKPQ